MKCAYCGGDYTYKSVEQRFGTALYAEYGCCSKTCYENKMTGIPRPNNNVHSGNAGQEGHQNG